MVPIGRQRAPTGLRFLHNSNLLTRGKKAKQGSCIRTGAEQGVSRELKVEGRDSKQLLKAPYKVETSSFLYKITKKTISLKSGS